MSNRLDIQEATGRQGYMPGRGTTRAWGTSAPTDSVQGFAPGCLWQNVAGTIGTCLYVNVGTFASSNWVAII